MIPSLKESIESVFGHAAFSHGLFYCYREGLRFELSQSGDAIDLFTTAYPKALEIAQAVFQQSHELHLCWTFYGPSNYLASLSVFKQFMALGIPFPLAQERWAEPVENEEDFFHHYLLFTVPIKFLKNALWGALAQDLGIRPKLVGSLYIYCLSAQILLHPYDDRGMDLIAMNHTDGKTLFKRFNHYLLDYDRAAMTAVYDRP